MRKWTGLTLSVLVIVFLFLTPWASNIIKRTWAEKADMGKPGIVLAQDKEEEEKGAGEETYSIKVLKQIRDKVDAWLKSLNEKIEREDVTRFKVRFYEILRNILEWVKEKLDSKIESSEEQRPKKKERQGLFQETRQRAFSIIDRG
jgi:hypothetical protein